MMVVTIKIPSIPFPIIAKDSIKRFIFIERSCLLVYQRTNLFTIPKTYAYSLVNQIQDQTAGNNRSNLTGNINTNRVHQ